MLLTSVAQPMSGPMKALVECQCGIRLAINTDSPFRCGCGRTDEYEVVHRTKRATRKEPNLQLPQFAAERRSKCFACSKCLEKQRCKVLVDRGKPGYLVHRRGILNPYARCPLGIWGPLPMQGKIHYAIPWDSNKTIGKAYNETLRRVGLDDWVCFVDGDAVHAHTFFGRNVEMVVRSNLDTDLFTCRTNRVNCQWQLAPGVDWQNDDLAYHRQYATRLWRSEKANCVDVTNERQLLSGVMILLSKRTWLRHGPFEESGMLGVDNEYHQRVRDGGGNVKLMRGVYVYHWYRGGDCKATGHLK